MTAGNAAAPEASGAPTEAEGRVLGARCCTPSLRQNGPTKQAQRRRISKETWNALAAAVEGERRSLPANSPRRRPTLPVLRALQAPSFSLPHEEGAR
jgi:hypothetical protein